MTQKQSEIQRLVVGCLVITFCVAFVSIWRDWRYALVILEVDRDRRVGIMLTEPTVVGSTYTPRRGPNIRVVTIRGSAAIKGDTKAIPVNRFGPIGNDLDARDWQDEKKRLLQGTEVSISQSRNDPSDAFVVTKNLERLRVSVIAGGTAFLVFFGLGVTAVVLSVVGIVRAR